VAQLPFAMHWRSSGRARTLGSPTMEFKWRGRGGPAVGRPGNDAESQFWIEISGSGSLTAAALRGRASRIASERGRGWRPDEGSKGMRERETLALSIYTSTYWVHVLALLTGFAGADSIFFKSVSRYPLGLGLYPCPCLRAQTQILIRAHRVWYPRVRGYFVPVAIPTLHICVGRSWIGI
jgi:hypothetical protein